MDFIIKIMLMIFPFHDTIEITDNFTGFIYTNTHTYIRMHAHDYITNINMQMF